MLRTTFDPLRGFSPQGTNSHVSLGWLETPEQFTRNCLALEQRPLFDCWALCAQLPDETVQVLQSPLVPNSGGLVMLESVTGVIYPVVVLQAAGLQVRMVLSLANARTQQWLQSLTSGGCINIAIEIPEVHQLAVISMPAALIPGLKVEDYIRRCTVTDREAFVREAGQLGRNLTEFDALPSIIPGFATNEVRVVLALENGPDHDERASETGARVLN